MMRASDTAMGYITSWAGRTRVTTSARGVTSVWLPNWRAGAPDEAASAAGNAGASSVEPGSGDAAAAHLRAALDELAEYFAGRRRVFTVALDPDGPAFFRRIWTAVAAVPYGETRSYAEIARAVDAPQAVRAVGAANGANPVAPFVPCHRIVGSNGMLVGYGPGVALKRRLLLMEDALPASEADVTAWAERVAERVAGRVAGRLGTRHLLLGVRGRGTYCRPECVHARHGWERPARFFADAEEARAAGFRACAVCQPDASARYAAAPLFSATAPS